MIYGANYIIFIVTKANQLIMKKIFFFICFGNVINTLYQNSRQTIYV